MKTLNIPKIREEHNAIKIATILCFVLAAVCLVLYLSNLGIGVSGAPAEFEEAMVNIHNLLVLGPFLFGSMGVFGLWFIRLNSDNKKQGE